MHRGLIFVALHFSMSWSGGRWQGTDEIGDTGVLRCCLPCCRDMLCKFFIVQFCDDGGDFLASVGSGERSLDKVVRI